MNTDNGLKSNSEEAKRFSEKLKALGLPVLPMEDSFLNMEHLLRTIEEGWQDCLAAMEKDNFATMMARGLLPLLANEKGVSLIGISSRTDNGQPYPDVEVLFDMISEYFRFANMSWQDPPRQFMVIPNDTFQKIIKNHLLTDQQQRIKYLVGINEDMSTIETFLAIVLKAIELKASDIHIEFDDGLPVPESWQAKLSGRASQTNAGRIRFRIDGKLQDGNYVLPKELLNHLVGTIMNLASGINPIEHRLPQDGKISFSNQVLEDNPQLLPDRKILEEYELRIAIMPPADGGLNVTIRLLKSHGAIKPLGDLIPYPRIMERFTTLIEESQGLVILCGPTGCGKTTTLYAALNLINDPDVKVLTLENPREIRLPGATQIEINDKIGRTFPVCLRAALRCDPDIILVGEIRDPETAQIAASAAETGHLVFTTLHTEGSTEAIVRLQSLGVHAATISGSIQAILSQRLVRHVCPKCSTPVESNELLKELLGKRAPLLGWPIYFRQANPEGCPECKRGYLSRVVIPEWLVFTTKIKDFISAGKAGDTSELRKLAIEEGLRPLAVEAILAAAYGKTTIQEILSEAVTSEQLTRCGVLAHHALESYKEQIQAFQQQHFLGGSN
ncbi:MAG: GspE/PulE family protein [Patescibacteria group bacterium]